MSTTRTAGMLRVLNLFLLIALTTHAQAATYRFKSLSVPGAESTRAASINDSGQVAGTYSDASGVHHGFMYSRDHYTPLDVSGAINTLAGSINDSGQVVGTYSDASGVYHGFVYSGGHYTPLNVPGAINTLAGSINDSGQVVGTYGDNTSGHSHGFVYSKGQYTSFDVPGATDTYADSINASGQVAGTYSNFPGVFGFVYREGKYTSLNVGRQTSAHSINDSGQVVGTYLGNLANPGVHGFMYSGGEYTVLFFPIPGPPAGIENTNPRSINASGQVVGSYNDYTSVHNHGFVYSKGQYTSFDVPGATDTYADSINASGQVAGSYDDASGSHGFIATPMTPFSTFNVTRLVIDQNRGALFLGSNFTLGKDSNGINPVKEEITLRIANATLTIPAGSFHKSSHSSFFAFAGQIDNVWIEALIKPVGRNRFAFQALAYSAPLGDTKNPVMVELTIGDDSGATTAQARTY